MKIIIKTKYDSTVNENKKSGLLTSISKILDSSDIEYIKFKKGFWWLKDDGKGEYVSLW